MDIEVRIPLWRLFFLSASIGSVDLGYAVEGAYAVPIIIASGFSLTFSTIFISISPLFGLAFQLFLGSASDQCTCNWGKRRPFIVTFALLAVLGFGLAPYCFKLKEIHFDESGLVVMIAVVSCVILFDFAIGALQLPVRAYLLDVVPTSQSQTGNFIFSVTIGVYAAFGYAIGTIDWSSLIGESVTVVHQVEVVFGITAGLIFVSLLLTIFSVKESKPIRNNKGNDEGVPLLNTRNSTCTCSCFQNLKDSIVDIVHCIYYMSYHMWILWFFVIFALAADFSFVYPFTTFVGIAVYNGDPSAPTDSYSYQQYAMGLRIGSIGLAVSTIGCSIVSLGIDYITRWINIKTVTLIVVATYALCTCLLMYFQQVYQVLILALGYGPFLATVMSVPFSLISVYEKSGLLFRKSWTNQPTVVEGKAVSVINTALFLGQIIAGLIVGPVVDYVGDPNYFMLIPCAFTALTFFTALFIVTP